MPTYNTGYLENVSVSGVRRYNQIVVLISNSSQNSGTAFLEGYYVLSGVNQPFASEGFDMFPQSNATRTYPTNLLDYFQIQVTVSLYEINVRMFGVSSSGQYTSIPVNELPIRRITSDYRDDMALTSADFPAISYQRRSTFSRPKQYAAALLPAGVEILATRPIRYKLVLGATVNGTYTTFPTATTQLSESVSALVVNDTCTTITGGQVIYQGEGTGLSGAYQNTVDNLINNQLLLALPAGVSITLAVSSLVGNDNVATVFRMEEQW
jgi:hypothetical protein